VTRAYIRIDLARDDAERRAARSKNDMTIRTNRDGAAVSVHASVHAPSERPSLAEEVASGQPPGRTLPTGRCRVLVVDDNLDSAEMLATLLRLWDHEVEVRHDGPSAIQAAQAFRPDVLVLDIGLPGFDGCEVARRIRQQADAGRPCLVAITGYGHDEDRRRTTDAGFDYHFTKPVDPERLQALLAQRCQLPAVSRNETAR
jgi:CheY-like chemotaxis protein